jgi:hypothetical protein
MYNAAIYLEPGVDSTCRKCAYWRGADNDNTQRRDE